MSNQFPFLTSIDQIKQEDDKHEIQYNGSEMKALQQMMNKSLNLKNKKNVVDSDDDGEEGEGSKKGLNQLCCGLLGQKAKQGKSRKATMSFDR